MTQTRGSISRSPVRVPRSPFPPTVVYVIDDLGMGGAQRQLTELVKALPRDRFQVHVISLSTEKCVYEQAIRDAGIPLELIPQTGAWSWTCLLTLYQRLRRLQPSIVHTWLFTADLYGRLAAWLARLPRLSSPDRRGMPIIISAIRSVDPWKPSHYVAVDRLLRHVTDAYTVNALAIGEVLSARERIPSSRITTIYNGVDLAGFDPSTSDGAVRQRIAVEAESPLIGTIGRLGPEKDHATFLRAAALAVRQVPQARFLIVGNGPLEASLRQLARVLGIEARVHVLSGQPAVAEVFAALDLVVISSRYEGCCNVILEAMAMGKPVIATDVGGNPELVVPGRTGVLVPPADPGRLAEAMVRLLGDSKTARAMGREGRRRVEAKFSVGRMVTETTELYDRLLSVSGHFSFSPWGRFPKGNVPAVSSGENEKCPGS